MSLPPWATDPVANVIRPFEERTSNTESTALFVWAISSIEGLYYLSDLDVGVAATPSLRQNHSPDSVDVAHARWATSGCINAIDLCAAGLGRHYCKVQDEEYDLGSFKPPEDWQKQVKQSWQSLPAFAQDWARSVYADPNYRLLLEVRHALIHRRVPRHFGLSARGRDRLSLEVTPGTFLGIRDLIDSSRDTAFRHVDTFVAIVPSMQKCSPTTA